jgi:hypothetical protein
VGRRIPCPDRGQFGSRGRFSINTLPEHLIELRWRKVPVHRFQLLERTRVDGELRQAIHHSLVSRQVIQHGQSIGVSGGTRGEGKTMNHFKPRSKQTFLRAMKGLKISKAAKDIIADIGVEIEGAAYDAVKELRADVLATLELVENELVEHNMEYQHLTSPEVQAAVRKAIAKLSGK